MKIPKEKWVWLPHAGHLIVGHQCRFVLATKIGKYLISTVGEWLPDSEVREILAQSRKFNLKEKGDAREVEWIKANGGYEDIGYNRKYETMVFKVIKSGKDKSRTCKACPWVAKNGAALDTDGYNKPEDAYKGHLKMCKKWANL